MRAPVRSPAALALLAWALLAATGAALGEQDVPPGADAIDRPVSAVRVEGLKQVGEQLVRNQIRTQVGEPYDPLVVKGDVHLIYDLGRFSEVTAELEPQADGTVAVVYRVVEAPIIAEVQVVGNKVISDQDLLAAAGILRGTPRDDFQIESAKGAMEAMYRERGFYLATVAVDESELEASGILFFRIVEGPRVRVKAIEFAGNDHFSGTQLQAEIKTRSAVPLLRLGELDQERLTDDVAALVRFYEDRGFIDIRVDRVLDLSPDRREVKVTFVIVEGPRYVLRSVRTESAEGGPLKVFAPDQIAALLELKPGDVYSRDLLRRSETTIRNAYLLMNYVDLLDERERQKLVFTELRSGEGAQVDLLITVEEGRPYKVGDVIIIGNMLTRDRVIRRNLEGIQPGRPFDGRAVARAAQKLRDTRLFNEVNITVQDADAANPDYRDVVVQVKESNTGSVNFGVAAGSDSGVFGEFSVIQRNFDIMDWPASFGELVSGRAFRGAGQRFSATLRPGDELFQYVMSWTEPALFDSQYSLRATGSWTDRQYENSGTTTYDEQRLSFPLRLGRQLGTIWDVGLNARFERVTLTNIALTAPVQYFQDAGPNNLTSVGIDLTRSTITSLTRPGEGTRLELLVEQVGAMLGDFTFSKVSADYTVLLTTHRDFMDRASILKLTARLGYIFGGEAPTYEKYYLGGRTLRGFEFRTVSPKGVDLLGQQTTDPVGGNWLMFLGAQYEIPLIGELLNLVTFVDSGTVTDDIATDPYRLSVGIGLRIYIQAFGPVPLAFDFGFPLLKEDSDEEQVFSFSAELPF